MPATRTDGTGRTPAGDYDLRGDGTGRIHIEGDPDLVAFVRHLRNPIAWLRAHGYDVTVRTPAKDAHGHG